MTTPKESVDAINGRFGRHDGKRALHAKGLLAKGTFTATPEAKRLTRAPHMQGDPLEVTARVSNGGGDPDVPDYAPDVRGLAVKIYLPDGSRTDISAQTIRRVPTSTPDSFTAFMKADTGRGRIWKLPLFLATHLSVLPALRSAPAGLKPPVSYATIPYYAVHAFKWIAADGSERFVRYTWVPEAGEDRLSTSDAKSRGPDYLQDELKGRLERGPVRFTLQVQIAAPGDPTDDASTLWPDDRETVDVGTLEITALETERETGGDVVIFDPTRVPDGIELSDDPVLQFRRPAYSESVERRSGIAPPA